MLESDQGTAAVQARINHYRRLGINAVPVVVIDDRLAVYGYPGVDELAATFTQLIAQRQRQSEEAGGSGGVTEEVEVGVEAKVEVEVGVEVEA
jgi:predicted DsbA family dithiol-disulfide isomerase